ncbi:glycosyltransferase family 2 protein [Candidatus Pelagibacter sp.]|nr:glycosyltransferase family 2 protein [Candidatus Pelagibacter sp.]
MFSILIPSYNNLNYLKLCIESILKNSTKKHEIIIHVNEGSDGTLEYVKSCNLKYTFSNYNIGLCSSLNSSAKISSKKYILYAHDDMYFCPGWDKHLLNEINNIGHGNFYLSGTMIEPNSGHIVFNCGESVEKFNENKLLLNYNNLSFYDHQGTHFAPHLTTKEMWNKVDGFSEEFNPGVASDPDFNMKLWKQGVRIFKGLSDFKVYHFGSVTTRKKIGFKQNRGDKIFLKKWGITTKFFKKYYLKSRTKYTGPLTEPKITIFYLIELVLCKIRKNFIF